VLLKITAQGRQGMNMMKADVGAVNLRHPGVENNAYMESKINMVGRTKGKSEGMFRGLSGGRKGRSLSNASMPTDIITRPSPEPGARGRGCGRTRRRWGISLAQYEG
jgi:hypothetical protein